MKWPFRSWKFGCLCVALATLTSPAPAQLAQIDQNAVLYATNYQRGVNYSSFRGAPGKAPVAVGSDGRAPAGGSPNQFQGVINFGALVIPKTNATLQAGRNFEQNAVNLNLSRGTVNNVVTMVLRTAQVGAPTYSQVVSFYFGSVVSPPSTDENGALLGNVSPATYWKAEPSASSNPSYYYSPHARQVFATVPGPIQITWQKNEAEASNSSYTNTVTIGGLKYALKTINYTVSRAAVKPTRKLYWTEKSFAATGKAVAVPSATVGAVYFAYNPSLLQTAANEFDDGYSNPDAGTTNATLPELRTIWYDPGQALIFAYNAEGRIFMELLGDVTGSGTREHLGYEIVDVFQQPIAQERTNELGEKITAYDNGTSDAALIPAPLQGTLNSPCLYQDASGSSGRTEYYSAALTTNPNDVLVHWLEQGLVGLRWPALYIRYQQVWPEDPAKFSHYLRPAVADPTEASQTAVQFSADNVPTIQFQDALDYPRAFLDENARFYTFLDQMHPQHRTLLRFNSGPLVAFERVLSTLNTELIRGTNSEFADVSGVITRPGQLSALVLDGTGYGQLPSGVYFNGDSYTIEAWVNVSEVKNWSRLMDFGNGAGVNNVLFALSAGTTGKPNTTHYVNGSGTGLTPDSILPTNQWVHLASVFDRASSNLTIYINGVASGSGPITPPANTNRTLNYVGKSNWPDALAKAQLDSFRIWTTARTATDLQQDMQTTSYASGTTGLLVQFAFDEGGRMAYDSSGNNLHMTLVSGATLTSANLSQSATPRYLYQTAYVGDRINPPAGELGAGNYLAGYVLQSSGTSFHPTAYQDPFVAGFEAANAGAIIPVNAIPGTNALEVWWFRQNATNAVRNPANGFDATYWPAVIARYSLAWPNNPTNQIVMAGNAGSGALASLQARAPGQLRQSLGGARLPVKSASST